MKDILIIATLCVWAAIAVITLGKQAPSNPRLTPEEHCEYQLAVTYEECFTELTK